MEEENVDNMEWTEEDLFRLPCKELKKLARQSNVNPTSKKADLVKALLDANVPSTMSEDTPKKSNVNMALRLTRSNSRFFQSSDFTDNSSKSELNKNKRRVQQGKAKVKIHSQDIHEHSEMLPSVSGLKRATTFTINENYKDSEKPEVQPSVSGIKRSNTFIDDDNNKGEPSENKLKERAKPSTIGKSLGNRILSSTQKSKSGQVLSKHTSGSSFKSTFGISKTKVPKFKSILEKFFQNKESVGDNQKRKLDRAQALLCPPMVPKRATLYKTPKKDLNLSKKFDSNNYKAGPSKIQSNRKTPSVDQAKTPAARQKPLMPGTSSVNRFGFKNRVNKLDAIQIVVNKLPPPMSQEKKREAERKLIKGVRMNKRFMLQMQMRQKMEEQ